MKPNSLRELYVEQLKDLYDADRLLLGIVVQKADRVKVTPIVGAN